MRENKNLLSTIKKAGNVPAKSNAFFQPKLSVNQPNDTYEQQADAMADKVMRMPFTQTGETFFKPHISSIQRKCRQCEDEEKMLHRKEVSNNETQGSSELGSYVGSLHSSGQPLPDNARKFFEPRFGHDFSKVKIHNDSLAAKSAQSINALAYTSGNNIVFNNNQFSPGSDTGKKLIAHELTHVVQQQGNINLKSVQRITQPANYQQPAPAQPPTTSEVNQHESETITNAPANASEWNKTFTWDAKFQVVYDLNAKRATIVSRLYSVAPDNVKAGWKSAIENRWGKGQFEFEVWNVCTPKVIPIDVDIQWVTDPAKAHYTITPRNPGDPLPNGTHGVGGTTGMTGWGTADYTDVPHEYGHMLGNAEEYFTTNGVDYTYGGTKSGFRDRGMGIMNNPSEAPMPRHYDLVRTGFVNMMSFPMDRTRVIQHGSSNPPLVNCNDAPQKGDSPQNNKAIG